AVHAAARVADRFEGGVWLADLSATADPDLAAHAIGSALRLQEQPAQPMVDTVIARLHDDEALVILDNCEHLPAACAELVERLLVACPGVRVLATSRELLG